MEDLGIDVDRAVRVLASALANAYWRAKVDANDAEWVFGLPRSSLAPTNMGTESGETREGENSVMSMQSEDQEIFNMRLDNGIKSEDMVVWMLDFDCVRPITMDSKGVKQTVDSFYGNDPYFPRPWAN